MKFGADIHDPQRMNTDFCGGPLTFHLAPQAGQRFYPGKYLSAHLSALCLVLISKF